MDELVIVDLEQGSEEWHALRRTKRSASMTPMVTGTSKFSGPADAYDYLVNGVVVADNYVTRTGKLWESRARSALELELGVEGRPVVGYRGDYLASLDYLSDDGTIVDIKVPHHGTKSATWKAAVSGQIEPGYADQLEHQYRVFRPERIGLYVWISDEQSKFVPYQPNEKRWDEIRRAWDRFWQEHVAKGVRPSEFVERNDDQWVTLAQSLIALDAQIKRLTENADSIREQLKKLAGDQSVRGGGVAVRRYFKRGVIDKDAAIARFAPQGVDMDELLEQFRKEGRFEQRIEIEVANGKKTA